MTGSVNTGLHCSASGSRLLTHCNAGALATAGSGTALSVIGTAARQGKVVRVFVDETRPLLQGARLTAWELQRAGIAVVLITDSTAGERPAGRKGRCRDHGSGPHRSERRCGEQDRNVPAGCPCALPWRSILCRSSVIHDRSRAPFGCFHSHRGAGRVRGDGLRRCSRGAIGIGVYAPAFDVTPNDLITAIVTDAGVLLPPFHRSIAEVFRAG